MGGIIPLKIISKNDQMKNKAILLMAVGIIFIASCSSNGIKATQDTLAPVSQAGSENRTGNDTMSANAGNASSTEPTGKLLIGKMDCIGCHKQHDKLVGPSFADIAAKYKPTEKNISYLSHKIIAGGQGVWGSVPMTPHALLSKDDATEMVKYILTVK